MISNSRAGGQEVGSTTVEHRSTVGWRDGATSFRKTVRLLVRVSTRLRRDQGEEPPKSAMREVRGANVWRPVGLWVSTIVHPIHSGNCQKYQSKARVQADTAILAAKQLLQLGKWSTVHDCGSHHRNRRRHCCWFCGRLAVLQKSVRSASPR